MEVDLCAIELLKLKTQYTASFFVNIGTHGVLISNVRQNESFTKEAVDVQHQLFIDWKNSVQSHPVVSDELN